MGGGILDMISQLENHHKASIEDVLDLCDESSDVIEFPRSLVKNYHRLGLKPNEWSLFCLIEAFYSEGEEIPNQTELARMMGMTPRNIQIIISDLKAKGLLETKVVMKRTIYNFKNLKKKAMELERLA